MNLRNLHFHPGIIAFIPIILKILTILETKCWNSILTKEKAEKNKVRKVYQKLFVFPYEKESCNG